MATNPQMPLLKQWFDWCRKWLGLLAAIGFLAVCIAMVLRRQSGNAHLTAYQSVMNPAWETINESTRFPEQLAGLHGRTVTLDGYMIPIEPGRSHCIFLLSVLPIHQCMFCGQDDIPPMIEVTLTSETGLPYTEQPVSLTGRIQWNKDDDTRPTIQLRDASPARIH